MSAPPLDDQLDFLSKRFNPLMALQSEGLALPDPRALPLDNLYKCRQLLPPDHPEAYSFPTREPKQNPQGDLDKSRTSYVIMKRQREEARRNPLQEIMDAITSGPLLLLKTATAEQARVRVLTRHVRGVRGTCTGTLVVFDKYMNLVLRDVEEEYTVLLRLERELQPDGRLGRGRRRQERRRRTLKQVFVRGDSVVCVQRPPAVAAAAAPGAAGGPPGGRLQQA